MKPDRDDQVRRVSERMQNQAREHWHEFSVIVASADVLLALLLIGRVSTTDHSARVVYLAVGISASSVLATILAYYSIQVGTLFVFGPLRFPDVVISFLLASAQLAMFLWPTHVLNVSPARETDVLLGLRHWLLLYATFALAAVLASRHAAMIRRRDIPGVAGKAYERRQSTDSVAASLLCGLTATCWGLSFVWLIPSMIVGLSVALAGAILGITSQARSVKWLLH